MCVTRNIVVPMNHYIAGRSKNVYQVTSSGGKNDFPSIHARFSKIMAFFCCFLKFIDDGFGLLFFIKASLTHIVIQ